MNRLSEFFDKKLAQAGPLPNPLEIGVRPPRRHGFIDVAEAQRRVRATRRKVDQLLKKFMEVK